MEDLWFNKTGLTRGERRQLQRANPNRTVDPRIENKQSVIDKNYTPALLNRGIRTGKAMLSCIGKYKVAPCVDDFYKKSGEWMIGGRKGPMPQPNACVENELKKSEKQKLTKAQIAELMQRKNEKIQEVVVEPPQYSAIAGNGEMSGEYTLGRPLKKQTCDSLFNQATNSKELMFYNKLTAIECLQQCAERQEQFREIELNIKEMESSPRYENSIKEFGKEYTDTRIANKKAGLCAMKRLMAWQCKHHKKEDTLNKYLPYIVGGLVLYAVLKK